MSFDAFSFNCPSGGKFHDMKLSARRTVSQCEKIAFALYGTDRVAVARKSVEVEDLQVRDQAARRQHGPAPQAALCPDAQASRERLKKLSADLKRRVA